MKKLIMLSRFCEIAKEFIPTLDEEGLEYDFMCNQVDINEQGPCCSDSKLIHLFRDNIKSELKDYVGFLFKSQEQISVEQSLVEYISPNLALLDQIATKGTYHIDQYMKKYICEN